MSAASEQLSTAAPAAGLTERDREIIAFERQWWKYAGSKETAIKELFLSLIHISEPTRPY